MANSGRPSRRQVLRCGLGIGMLCSICGSAAAQDADDALTQVGDRLIKADDPDRRPVTPKDVLANTTPMLVWPMDHEQNVRDKSRLNQILLVRVEGAPFTAEVQARAADGVLAYSAICTHQGCQVVEWRDESHTLLCPCHDSEFDPKDDGKVVDGPATRSLPALPLKIVDGELAVAGPFSSKPGFS